MFDVGGLELLLVFIILLVVAGPDKLPGIIRSIGRWTGYARRTVNQFKRDFEDEFDVAELKRELQESARIEELKDLEKDLKSFEADLDDNFVAMDESVKSAGDYLEDGSEDPTKIGPAAPAKSPTPTELNNASITSHQKTNDTSVIDNSDDAVQMTELASEPETDSAPKYSGDDITRMAELASGQSMDNNSTPDNNKKHEDSTT